jgi:predicted TIM-barrel fold metal-dependent hydrolase
MSMGVIDADGHVLETEMTWAALDPRYKAWRPRWVTDPAGVPRVLMEGRLYQKPHGLGRGHPDGLHGPNQKALNNGGMDPHGRLTDMEIEGIDVAIMYPTLGLAIGGLEEAGFATAFCRAYNDWVAEYCRTAPGRLKGVALVALQDVAAAVQEVRRCIEQLGMVGVMLPTNVRGQNLSQRAFDPLFAAVQELGVPVGIHTSTGFYNHACGEERFESFALAHAASFAFEGMLALASFVCEGIWERFPRLKVVFLEASIGWVPWWLERLDEHFELRGHDMPEMTMPASAYVQARECYFSCDPDEKGIPLVVQAVGEDRILYASDYPHWDARFPDSVRLIRQREDLSETAKQKILGANAAHLYGL